MIEINLEKELEMYFYNKGLGSEVEKKPLIWQHF